MPWSFSPLSTLTLHSLRYMIWITIIPTWLIDTVCRNNILYSICTIKEFFRKWISQAQNRAKHLIFSIISQNLIRFLKVYAKYPLLFIWILLKPANGVVLQYANIPISLYLKKKGRYFKYECSGNLKGLCRKCTAVVLLTSPTYCTHLVKII